MGEICMNRLWKQLQKHPVVFLIVLQAYSLSVLQIISESLAMVKGKKTQSKHGVKLFCN